jgi:hypothetical protein
MTDVLSSDHDKLNEFKSLLKYIMDCIEDNRRFMRDFEINLKPSPYVIKVTKMPKPFSPSNDDSKKVSKSSMPKPPPVPSAKSVKYPSITVKKMEPPSSSVKQTNKAEMDALSHKIAHDLILKQNDEYKKKYEELKAKYDKINK